MSLQKKLIDVVFMYKMYAKKNTRKSEFHIFTSNQKQTVFVDLNQFNMGGFSTILVARVCNYLQNT